MRDVTGSRHDVPKGYCAACGAMVSRQFKPGPNGRPDATCPRCGSLERHRFLSLLLGPIPNSILDTKAPFRYDLTGQQRLHPAFNTYFAKVGTRVWKFQLVDYYSNTGLAGYPTIRYARIR